MCAWLQGMISEDLYPLLVSEFSMAIETGYPWPSLKTGTWGGETPADGSGEIPQASGLGWWRRGAGKLVKEDGQTLTCCYTHVHASWGLNSVWWNLFENHIFICSPRTVHGIRTVPSLWTWLILLEDQDWTSEIPSNSWWWISLEKKENKLGCYTISWGYNCSYDVQVIQLGPAEAPGLTPGW